MSYNYPDTFSQQPGRHLDPLLLKGVNAPQTQTDQFDQIIVYKGRLAKRVNNTAEKIKLAATSEYPQPIESKVGGELVGFTVATNNPEMKVTCFIYDGEGDVDTIVDSTIKEVTYLGYGMTHGEAIETDGMGLSVDKTGSPHPIKPYVLRYKSTRSSLALTYAEAEGLPEDEWYVLDYAPVIKEAYSRLFFNITNKFTEQRMIHFLTFRRIDYIPQNELRSSISDTSQIPVDDSVFQMPGDIED